MKTIANKSIPLFQLEESHLESKYRSEGFTYMSRRNWLMKMPLGRGGAGLRGCACTGSYSGILSLRWDMGDDWAMKAADY